MSTYRIEVRPTNITGSWRKWVDFRSEAAARVCKERMFANRLSFRPDYESRIIRVS